MAYEAPDLNLVVRSWTALADDQRGLLLDNFYSIMFKDYPEFETKFFKDVDMVEQKKKLAAALNVIVQHCQNPTAMSAELDRLGKMHKNLGVTRYMLYAAQESLMKAFRATMKTAWNSKYRKAWISATGQVVRAMYAAYEEPVDDSYKEVLEAS